MEAQQQRRKVSTSLIHFVSPALVTSKCDSRYSTFTVELENSVEGVIVILLELCRKNDCYLFLVHCEQVSFVTYYALGT